MLLWSVWLGRWHSEVGVSDPGRKSGLQLSVQLPGRLHWFVHIRRTDNLVPAVTEPPLAAVPSTPQGTGPSLSPGCEHSLSHPCS